MTFLGSFHFQTLLESVEFVILDIGARDGILPDLRPLAPVTRAIGFEPDQSECSRLNTELKTKAPIWKSEEYIPVALGARTGEKRMLQLCQAPGCTSLLTPDTERTARFGREDNFTVVRQVELETLCLDDAARRFNFPEVDFIKIDIQGAELEVFQGASEVIRNGLLGVLSEVEFTPLYREQALFSEVEILLRQRGLEFFDFTFERRWRLTQGLENLRFHPAASVPFSRGQLVHADALFFRNWTLWLNSSEVPVEKFLKLALLLMTFEYLDEAYAILSHPKVKALAGSRLNFDLEREMATAARYLKQKRDRNDRQKRYHQFKKRIRQLIVK